MPRPKYCWDSSVFIALLTGEERAEGETEGLLEIVDAADCGKAVIVASAQVMTEVLPDLDDPTVSRRLEDLFKRAAFQMFDINQPILTKAGEHPAAGTAERSKHQISRCSDCCHCNHP